MSTAEPPLLFRLFVIISSTTVSGALCCYNPSESVADCPQGGKEELVTGQNRCRGLHDGELTKNSKNSAGENPGSCGSETRGFLEKLKNLVKQHDMNDLKRKCTRRMAASCHFSVGEESKMRGSEYLTGKWVEALSNLPS